MTFQTTLEPRLSPDECLANGEYPLTRRDLVAHLEHRAFVDDVAARAGDRAERFDERDIVALKPWPMTADAGRLPRRRVAPVRGDRVDTYLDNGTSPSKRKIAISKAKSAAAAAKEAFLRNSRRFMGPFLIWISDLNVEKGEILSRTRRGLKAGKYRFPGRLRAVTARHRAFSISSFSKVRAAEPWSVFGDCSDWLPP